MLLTASPNLTQRLANVIVQFFPRMLGGLFLFTSYQKIERADALRSIFTFDGFPAGAIQPLIAMVIALEILLGLSLLSFIWFRRTSLIASIVLLSIYVIQLGYLLLWDNAPSCGCLEGVAQFDEARTKNMLSLVRNICLILPAFWTWLQISPMPARGFSMEENK